MPRKKVNRTTEYAVTRIGYCVGGDLENARIMAKEKKKIVGYTMNEK